MDFFDFFVKNTIYLFKNLFFKVFSNLFYEKN